MGIIFNNFETELDFSQAEEVLSFCNKMLCTAVVKINNEHATARLYLPKCFIVQEQLKKGDKLYITQSTIKKTVDNSAFKVSVQTAGKNSFYINFPRTLLYAYNPTPTHIRLTYNATQELWEYRLVKKEIL